MNDLKPVAWHTEDKETDKSATTYEIEVANRWKMKGWPVTPMYLAIPDTHRVVSVELLESAFEAALSSSAIGTGETANQLRAIIDNKEAR